MKIVLLEPLGISEKKLSALVRPFLDAGHAFVAMPESSEEADWLREAKDADVVVIGNKPLPGEFISMRKAQIHFGGVYRI